MSRPAFIGLFAALFCVIGLLMIDLLTPRPEKTFKPTAVPPAGDILSGPGGTRVAPLPDTAALAPSIPDQLALVDSDRMMLSINYLVSAGNRYNLVPAGGLSPVEDWLLGQFQAIQQIDPQRIDAWKQDFTFVVQNITYNGENIVLVIYGTDLTAGTVVIGAHYDTISRVGNTYQPGADDNGSGVAAVLEIARIVANQPHTGTVICVLFGAEEEGRFGSQAFVRDIIGRSSLNLVGMINLDMIGSPLAEDGSVSDRVMRVYSAPPDESPSRQLAWMVQRVAAQNIPELSVEVYNTLDRDGRWGDHQSFSDAGYAAVRLIEAAEDSHRMHNLQDMPETIDPVYLRHTTQVALAAVLTLAN